MSKSTRSDSSEERGSVVDAARELLAEGRTEEMLALVTELATRAAKNAADAAAAMAREQEATAREQEVTAREQAAAVREQAAAARVTELERRLEKLLARYQKSEAVSKTQLVLFLDAISRGEAGDVLPDPEDPRPDANARLRDLSKCQEGALVTAVGAAKLIAVIHRSSTPRSCWTRSRLGGGQTDPPRPGGACSS